MWALPPQSHTTYAPYDSSRAIGELIGHTDAVWDLALVRDESTLISCGAEGAVKVWDVSKGGGTLKLSWLSDGLSDEQEEISDTESDTPGATAVEAIKTDLKKVAVAYQNTIVKIFDIETGREVLRLQTDISHGLHLSICEIMDTNCVFVDDEVSTQINSLVSHPTMPMLITAHEDKHIRIFDITTGKCLSNEGIKDIANT
jgi:striatin 1/3/4